MLKELIEERFGRDFWTSLDEFVEDMNEIAEVLEACDEYVVVTTKDEDEEDGDEIVIYLGHANTTIWIERIRLM